jgi:hypothetical protein
MSIDTLNAGPTAPERRPAVWPWLLMPFVTLALFFALRTVRDVAAIPAPSAVIEPSALISP